MAWNEPGGNSNDKDPWGSSDKGKKKNERPSQNDLDETLRKLQDNVTNLFGKKGKGGSGSGGGSNLSKQGGIGIVLIAILIIFGLWLYKAVYQLDEQEKAVILRFGQFHEIVGPGLHIYFPPMDSKYAVNVTSERSYQSQGQMLTEDENIVEVPLTVQYNISDVEKFVLNVANPEKSLEQATDSALRHVVGSMSMDQVITSGRAVLADETKVRLQNFMDNYGTGITITQVNVQNAQAPRQVQDAFDDVIRAREDEQREKNQADTYARGIVPEARGQAQRMLEEAQGYRDEVIARAEGEAKRFNQLLVEYQKAPEVTRERLYIEAMQDVLANTSKVMTSGGEQGANSMLYLPLDKMLENRTNTRTNNSQYAVPEIQNTTSNAQEKPQSTARPTGDSVRNQRSREIY